MAAQLHLQSHRMTSQVLQPLGCPGPLLRPHYSSNRTRKTAGPVPARAAKQQQPRPVFIDDRGTASFLDWARAQGIEFPKLQPATFEGVRGLAAKTDIAADDIIVSVPRQQALTLPPKQRCPCPEFVTPAYWDASPWFVKLGVRLLCEQRKGPASAFSQWIQQQPQQVDSPVNWSVDQVQQLQYAHLVHKVTEQQREWAGLYDKFVTEGLVNKSAAPPSKQDFFKALSLVRSRTFSGPYVASTLQDRFKLGGLVAVLVLVNTAAGGDLSNGLGAAAAVFLFNIIYELLLSNKLKQYAMCPVIDLINHSSINTSEVSYDYPRDTFIVSAAAAYSPDSQVFISYGTQNNDSLLQMYGFVEQDNPHDVYVMTSLLKWLEQLQPPCQQRLDTLNKGGLLQALQEVVITRKGFGAETLQALRYLLVPAGSSGAAAVAGSNGAAAAAAAAAGSTQGLPAGAPSSYASPADAATEQKLGLVLVHACQQELSVLGAPPEARQAAAAAAAASAGGSSRSGKKAGRSGGGSNGSSVPAAVAAATAAAFRQEKRKVLLACLEQLTGEAGGGAAAAGAGSGREDGAQQQQQQEAAPSKR